MKINKNPLIVCTSLLGLTLAVTGCTTTNASPSPMPKEGKMMGHDGQRGAHGEGKGHMWQKEGKGGMGRLLTDLNLTDTQKAQMQQLRTQNQAKMQQVKAQLDQMDATIASQKAAGASSATLLNLYQQKQAVMNQFFAMHQQEKQQFMSILTPDQQLKVYQAEGERGRGVMKK